MFTVITFCAMLLVRNWDPDSYQDGSGKGTFCFNIFQIFSLLTASCQYSTINLGIN